MIGEVVLKTLEQVGANIGNVFADLTMPDRNVSSASSTPQMEVDLIRDFQQLGVVPLVPQGQLLGFC